MAAQASKGAVIDWNCAPSHSRPSRLQAALVSAEVATHMRFAWLGCPERLEATSASLIAIRMDWAHNPIVTSQHRVSAFHFAPNRLFRSFGGLRALRLV